jgi:RHS repeat-associated protein
MTAAVGARNLFKVDAGVVHALLQARYYDGSKGEFLSEDPVFWGAQNIAEPQSLNSYSYANDNPISRSDPNGLATVGGTRNAILSQLKSQLLGAAAYLQSVASNPRAFAGNVAAGASIVRSNPGGVASAYGAAIKQGVSQTVNDLYYGNDATQDQALASSIIFFGTLAIPDVGMGGDAAKVPQVLANKAAGDAFRDSVAATMSKAGYDVQTEVYKKTGLGPRYIDIDVSKNGVNLGGVETKTGSSPYTTSQRAKDAWLKWTSGYIVTVVRNEP